jgi:hypothetical protein
MRLTVKEEKIARLALDKVAEPGEFQSTAIKLIESFRASAREMRRNKRANERSTQVALLTPRP